MYSIKENRHCLIASLYREAYKSNLGYRVGKMRGGESKNMTLDPYLALVTI